MGRVQLLGVLLLGGAAVGCGGQLAQPDGGGGGTGGFTAQVYTWVSVEPVGVAADAVKLAVEQAGNTTIRIYPPATEFLPTNGATVRALYGCDGQLAHVAIETCAQQADLASMSPACLWLNLSETLVGGEYVETSGVHWQVTAATAELRLPPPPNQGGLQDDVGVGTFTAECRDTAGNVLTLDGIFAVPVRASYLLC
jgi:hypothetical protein